MKAELSTHSPNETTYLELILQIAEQFRFVNADSVLHYAARGRRLGTEFGQDQFDCKWENLSAMSYLYKGQHDSAMFYAMRQMKLAQGAQTDSLLV